MSYDTSTNQMKLGENQGGGDTKRSGSVFAQFVGPLLGGLIGVGGALAGAFANNHFQAEREQRALFRDERRQVYVEVNKASLALVFLGKSKEAEIELKKYKAKLWELVGEVALVGRDEVRQAMKNVYTSCKSAQPDNPSSKKACTTALGAFNAAARKEMGIE